MVSRDGRVSTLPEVLDLLGAGVAFVRPDEDNKAFIGGVYDADWLRAETVRWAQRTTGAVIVAAPREIWMEWRLFMVGGDVVAASSYRSAGAAVFDAHVPSSVVDFGEKPARTWSPAPIFCLDVATTDAGLGVVEVNCFNASRLYGANVSKIVSAVSRHVVDAAGRPRG